MRIVCGSVSLIAPKVQRGCDSYSEGDGMSKTYMVYELPNQCGLNSPGGKGLLPRGIFETDVQAWQDIDRRHPHDTIVAHRADPNRCIVIAVDNVTGDVEKCDRPEDEYLLRAVTADIRGNKGVAYSSLDLAGWLWDERMEIHKRRTDGSGYDRLSEDEVKALIGETQ